MSRIESALHAAVTTEDPFTTQIVSHLVPAGGKRLRPAFAVAAALADDPGGDGPAAVSDDMITGGVAIELLHLGSLYHDDVMDNADTRRGVETVNRRWGNLKAILAGDLLFGKASELGARLGATTAELVATAIQRLCEGQVRELQHLYDVSRTEAQYRSAIEGKTASLYAASCRIGGLIAGVCPDVLERLSQFGHSYGMAFQVMDDVLDFVASEEALGKPAGNDLGEGVYTLPVIRMVAAGHGIGDLLGGPLRPEVRARAHQLVLDGGELAGCVRTACEYVTKAETALDDLAPTPTVAGMRLAARALLTVVPDVCRPG